MALAGGSVAAATALAACGGESSANAETADFGDGDAGILNYLLTLEYLLADFYSDLSSSTLFSPGAQKALGKFGTQEEEHAGRLVRLIEKSGGQPGSKPQSKFALKTESGTLEIASDLENAAAAAYLGQLPNIEDEGVLQKVLEIHSVEGRHAAAIDYLLGRDMTPDGTFAKPATVKSVMAVMKPYMAETASV
jgi:rubrerythrin